MRYRERNRSFTSKTYMHSWYWPTRARYAYEYTEMDTASRHSERMFDVNTSGFSTVRNQGGIVCSPMYSEELHFSLNHNTAILTGTDYGIPVVVNTHNKIGLTGAPASELDEASCWVEYEKFGRLTDLAIVRAHAGVDVSEINLWASVGELPETIAWIVSLITRAKKLTVALLERRNVVKTLRSLKYAAEESGTSAPLRRLERYMKVLERRKMSRVSKDSQMLADLWLEWRYAIRPLINDIQNGIAAIEKILESKRFTARGHEYSKGEATSYETFGNYPTPGLDQTGVRVRVVDKELIRARAGCLYTVDTQITNMLDVLGIDQPVEAIYELHPYSFMLDWVFGLGDYLNAIFKSSGLDILTSWSVLQVEVSQSRLVTGAVTGQPGDPEIRWNDQQHVFGSSHIGYKRKWRLPNPPFPSLPPPDLKIDLGKLIDIGTILKNVLAGKSVQVAKRS